MKLNQCPFCGSKEKMVLTHMPLDIAFFVECKNCDARGPMESKKSHAIQGWNSNFRENKNRGK